MSLTYLFFLFVLVLFYFIILLVKFLKTAKWKFAKFDRIREFILEKYYVKSLLMTHTSVIM